MLSFQTLATPDAKVVVTDDFQPVSVEEVAVQTEVVVESYFCCRCSQTESLHSDLFTEEIFDEHYSEKQIGQNLAVVAEEIEASCGTDLDRLVDRIKCLTDSESTENDWYVAFQMVVDSCTGKDITWSKIVIVFTFGYKLFQKVFQDGWRCALKMCMAILVRYLTQRKVLSWLAKHGGWIASRCLKIVHENTESASPLMITLYSVAVIALLSAPVVYSVIYLARKRPMGP